MTENLTDEQLVALAASDDSDAFGEIVRRWERKVYSLCYGMLNNSEDAMDAAQETFISAYRNISGFRGEAKVSSWLHRIAVNQCLTKMRRTKARPEGRIEDSDEQAESNIAAPASSSPLSTTERNESSHLVRQALAALPMDLRQVVVMKEFEEMTFQEISDTLGVPLSTVKSRLYTALKQLRMRLDRTPVEVR